MDRIRDILPSERPAARSRSEHQRNDLLKLRSKIPGFRIPGFPDSRFRARIPGFEVQSQDSRVQSPESGFQGPGSLGLVPVILDRYAMVQGA